MPQLVDVDGLGTVEFPDDFTPAQIEAAWQSELKPLIEAKRAAAESQQRIARGRNAAALPEISPIGEGFEGAGRALESSAGNVIRGLTKAVVSPLQTAGTIADYIRTKTGDAGSYQLGPDKRSGLTQLAEGIEQKVAEYGPRVYEEHKDQFLAGDVASGLGQVGGMLLGGGAAALAAKGLGKAVVPAAMAATTTMGFTGEFGDAFERAKARGDDADTALAKAMGYASVASLIENKLGAGRLLKKWMPDPSKAVVALTKAGVAKEILKDLVVGYGEEALQRAAQDLIVDGKLDPEGINREGLAGGFVQALVGAPAAGRRYQMPQPQPVSPIAASTPAAPVAPTPVSAPQVAPPQAAPITPAAALPAPAPVAPVVQPVAAQPIQQAPPKEQLTPPTAAQRSELEDIRGDLEAAQLAGDAERVKYLTNLLRVKEREAWTKKVTAKPRRVAITPEAQAAAPKRQQKNLPIGDGFSVRTELDSPDRKQYLIVGQLGRPVGRIDLVKDSSGIWRPTPGAGLEINDQLARGKGLVQKSLQALLPELKAIGSSGISEDVTSQSAARMWQRMGATIENVTPGDIGEAKAYVLRSQSPKRQQALPQAEPMLEPLEGQPYDTRLETRPEATMPAIPVGELGIERGRVSPVDPDLAAAVEDIRGGYVERVVRELADSESVNRVTPLTGQQRQFAEGLAKKYGAPALPLVPAAEPYEQLSRFSNMLERAADRSKDPSELAAILEAANGATEESRIAWAIIQNPYSSDATYTKAKRNPAVLRMTSQENVDRTDSRRAELRAQRNLAGYSGQAPTNPAQPAPAVAAKEPWEMTREEYKKTLGGRTNQMTGEPFYPEGWPLSDEAVVAWRKLVDEDRRLLKAKLPTSKDLLDWKGGTHLAVIQQAISEGKPVPPAVLADYPELKQAAGKAAKQPEPAYISPEEVDTVGKTKSGQPVRREVVETLPSEAAGEGAPEKRDKSKPEQMTPEEYVPDGGSYKEQLAQAKILAASLAAAKKKLIQNVSEGGKKMIRSSRNEKHREAVRQRDRLISMGESGFLKDSHGYYVRTAASKNLPLSAAAVDTYGIKLPPGYIREGDLYVYRPEVKPEEGRGVIPKEGVGSIYQMERGGETKWLVQQGENRGFGDSIFDTEQEAVAESQREAMRREQRAESLRKLDAEKSAEAKAKAEREDLGTFTDGMSPMKRGSVVKQLTARFRYLGKEMSRRDIIRELVNQGRKVEVEEGQRVLSNDKGEYLGEKVLTKAGLDYAEHLIQERDAQMSLGQTPTARPAPSLSKMQVEQAVRELFDGNTPPNFQVTHNYGKTYNGREVRGWYDPATGAIWLNAAYLRSPQEARAVFIEEAFHAIQNDKAVQQELSRLVASLTPEQLSTARAAYGNISEEQLQMEAVADILEKQQLTQEQRGILARLWDAVLGAVQRLYGKFTGKVFTERDAQDILAKALKAAAVGKRSLKGGGEVYAEGGLAAKAKAFFSRLFRTVEQSQQNKASGAQWKATIKNSKLGANLDEMALVGVNDLEDGKMYSKQEVLDYLQANQVEVKDVTLGADAPFAVEYSPSDGVPGKPYVVWNRKTGDIVQAYATKRQADDYVSQVGSLETHFSTYQLPGAKEGSYREVLLTVPGDTRYVIEQHDYGTGEISDPLETSFTIRNLVTGKESESFETREEAEKLLQEKGRGSLAKWSDGHSQYSSIANPIVRLRFNERQTQDGKRMLFLEEVQAPQKGQFEKMPALFQKNWREIAFKWALRHAAENGFEVIGWTTGEQQAERYDLSKQVDHIEYTPNHDGTYGISVMARGSVEVWGKRRATPEEIEANIGKELLKKIEANEGEDLGEYNRLSGVDIKVGGEGLKKLYDVDFRNVVNKLPAVRSAGGKVGSSSIATPQKAPRSISSDDVAEWQAGNPPVIVPIHSLPITPAIADSVMGGQAMFSAGSPQNQLDQKYFEAIQRGDMQEVQALVDEAARGAGYNVWPMFHGTDASFTEFKYGGGRLGQGFYFASTPSQAREYGGKVMRVFLREGNLLREGDISEGGFPDPEEDGYAFRDAVESAGYTGIDGFEETVVYSPSQIKSADPITYDDQGDIIPLSQRFQQESPDIRYSLGEPVKGIANENTGTIRGDDSIGASQEPSQNQQRLRPLYQDQGLQAGASGFSVQNASRVAKDLESSGAVLWGTEPEIEAAYLDANSDAIQAGKPTPPTLTGGQVFRGPVYPGTKATSEGVSGKPRVLITRAAKSLLLLGQSNSDILAHRFLFGADKASNHRDFNLGLFQKLPKLRIVFEPVGAAPLAAYYRSYDTIIVNQAKLDGFDLSNPATAALLDAVISEELIHAAVNRLATNEEILSAWTGLSDMERKTAKDIYGITNPVDGFTDIQFANEYLRLVLQQRLSGKTTEQVVPISSQLKKILQKLVDFLKRSFGNKPENSVARQLVERIEGAIRGNAPIKQPLFPSSGEALATNISQSDATEVQGRAIEPSIIAAAGRAVADLGRQTVDEFEQAGRELEGLAYESKAFRQARSELNNLVSLHEGRLRQLPQDRVTDDMRANIRDGVSIENFQIVVGDELVTKLAQMGVQFRPELVKALQAEVYFEQQARRLVDNLGKLATLKELRDYYIRIKAPTDEIEKLNELIAAKEKVVANLSPVTTNRGRGQQSIGERAGEIVRATASKVELQAKRDALTLEPVQEFFGKGITELRDLSEKAKAAADLTRALMDSSTSISEVARLGEIYDKWASFDQTVKDALKKGTLKDEQRASVLTSLQRSFDEFDIAKSQMDDLLNSEEKGLLKDIRLAEADIADAKVTSGLADVLVADALKAAKGEMGLTGTVGDAANIANLEASTGAITTLAMNLGRTIDQNRWLYDFLMAPGDMPAFGASVAQSLGISETALREVLKVVQQSPSLASAIVTLTDDAAAKLANSPPNQMQSIATLATSGNPVAMALAANLTSQIVQQANAQGTKANAARQAAARQLAQSVLRLRTLQQGQALFNQTANSPAFQQLRGAANAGAAIAQKMVVLGPTGPVLRGFKSAAKDYQPELKINVQSDAIELAKTRDKVWKYVQNAEQYIADYEAAEAAYITNPTNPSPQQLGFDIADYKGLKFAIENDIPPMFFNMGDVDDTARAAQLLTPVGVRKLMKAGAYIGQIFLQHEQLGKMIGGFAGNTFRQQIAKYKRGYLNAKAVASQFQDLPKLQSAAMQSHNIKSEDTYRKIFNEMAHYGRLFGTPLRVGFKLPTSQQIVTKEDMQFFKRTLAYEEKLRREVTEIDPVTGVRYVSRGKELTRKGAYVGDLGMPRHLNRGATKFIANVTDAYAATPKGFTPATDLSASSQDAVAAYWNEHLNTLKDHVLNSLRTDRTFKQTAEMAAAEKRIAARWLAGNMDQVNSVQDLVDLIAAEIPATTGKNPLDTAREGLNNELLQYLAHAQRIQKERAEDNAKNSGLSIALSSENEYTKPAANLELPSEYYDYGAVSSIDRITAQARANHSSLIDFANSIRLAITELQSRMDQLKGATTDKQREAILVSYKSRQEMEDVLQLLTTSLKNFEDSYRAGGPDLVPTKLGQKFFKATVGSVLASIPVAIKNLSQGQIQVFTNLRAMNYMSAMLAAWKALSNVPRGLINTSYMVSRNIAGFADRRLGRDPQFQRTLKGAVDVIADGIFKTAQTALLKPRVGAENVRKSFERVFALGFDTSGDWWDAAKQAWTESGQFRNQIDQDEAMKSRTSRALNFLNRLANTGLDTTSAIVRGSVLESSDTGMNALSLGLSGNLEQRLEQIAMVFGKRLTDAGITSIDPTDKRAVLQPNEWLPSLNQQTAMNSLAEIRKFLESSAASEGFLLEKNLLQYYQDKIAGRPAEIFNQRTFDAVQRSMIAENNAALPTNRASAGQASTLWRTMLALQGYPADAMLKLMRISTGGSRDRKVVLQAWSKMSFALGFAAMAIILTGSGDAGNELWKRKMQGKRADRPTPLDADFYTDPDHLMRAMGNYLLLSTYYLGDAIRGAYGFVDGRSSIEPSQKIFAVATASQIVRDLMSGGKIAYKGGTTAEALDPLRRSMTRLTFGVPELEYLLGKERDNTEAAKRGIMENAKAKGFDLPSPGFTGTVGLTNVKRKALSQAVSDMDIAQRKGDTEGYAKAKAAAQKQLTDLEAYYLKQRLEAGDSPEVAAKTAKASVWGDYQENNPVTAALGGKRPTAEQYKQLVESSTGERGQVIRQGIKAWQDGAQALFGKPGNITKEDVAENRPGGTVREPSYGRVSLTGGVSGRMKSVGVAPSRGRRAKIRRISLTGRRRKISPMRGRRKKIRRVRLTA